MKPAASFFSNGKTARISAALLQVPLRRADMVFYHEDVDIMFLKCPWPKAQVDQEKLLRSLRGWALDPDIDEFLSDYGFHLLHVFNLNAGHGPRWFHVWGDPWHKACLVLKQSPASHVVVQCSLTAADQRIHAEFVTLGGRIFASKVLLVEAITLDKPLRMYELIGAARKEAVKQNLLESIDQGMELVISGVQRALPAGLVLWDRNTVDEKAFESKLAQLTNASDSELAAVEFFSDMDEETSDMDDEPSDRE